jgi:NADH-quinone oxidoreductase subunit L
VDWEKRERARLGWTLIHNKYYVDEIYNASVIRGVLALRVAADVFDRYAVDGIVNSVSFLTKGITKLGGAFDARVVDGAVNGVAEWFLWIGSVLRRFQTGRIQNYAFSALGVATAFAAIVYLIRYYGVP